MERSTLRRRMSSDSDEKIAKGFASSVDHFKGNQQNSMKKERNIFSLVYISDFWPQEHWGKFHCFLVTKHMPMFWFNFQQNTYANNHTRLCDVAHLYIFLSLFLSLLWMTWYMATPSLNTQFCINISNWRKRGVASNPLLIIPGFSLHFSLEPSYGYLRFEGNGKIPLGK